MWIIIFFLFLAIFLCMRNQENFKTLSALNVAAAEQRRLYRYLYGEEPTDKYGLYGQPRRYVGSYRLDTGERVW